MGLKSIGFPMSARRKAMLVIGLSMLAFGLGGDRVLVRWIPEPAIFAGMLLLAAMGVGLSLVELRSRR